MVHRDSILTYVRAGTAVSRQKCPVVYTYTYSIRVKYITIVVFIYTTNHNDVQRSYRIRTFYTISRLRRHLLTVNLPAPHFLVSGTFLIPLLRASLKKQVKVNAQPTGIHQLTRTSTGPCPDRRSRAVQMGRDRSMSH